MISETEVRIPSLSYLMGKENNNERSTMQGQMNEAFVQLLQICMTVII